MTCMLQGPSRSPASPPSVPPSSGATRSRISTTNLLEHLTDPIRSGQNPSWFASLVCLLAKFVETCCLTENCHLAMWLAPKSAPHSLATCHRSRRRGCRRFAVTAGGSCQVVVATVAFGMGIDKPSIRRVVHYGGLPSVPRDRREMGGGLGRSGGGVYLCPFA